MSARRAVTLAPLVLCMLMFPGAAPAQSPPSPLTATLSLANPPANLTFDGTTPIEMILQINNGSGAPVITTDGFSATDFWRQLKFQLEGFGTITNPDLATGHADIPFGTCHYRNGIVVDPIQVVAVEELPAGFGLTFTFDDARAHFDLTRAGHYTVAANLSYLTYTTGAMITDCDVEFGGKSLLSFGASDPTGGRQQFDIVSNSLGFFIQPSGEKTPPTTTVTASPVANAAGWTNDEVALRFTATDNSGGSGVKSITVNLFGAQTGTRTISGTSGSVRITADGITTAFYNAEDNAGNKETVKSHTVRVDEKKPVVTPPASVTVIATEVGGARGSASPALAAFLAGGSAVDNLDPAPVRLTPQVGTTDATNGTLFPLGSTTVTFRFQDVAGNIGRANSSVKVVPGNPAISGAAARISTGVYDLTFTNTGTGIARNVSVNQFSFKTLIGTGKVSYDSSRSPKLPIALGDLAVGASRTIRVYLVVPSGVSQFSITESGKLKDVAGTTSSFSTTQTVLR